MESALRGKEQLLHKLMENILFEPMTEKLRLELEDHGIECIGFPEGYKAVQVIFDYYEHTTELYWSPPANIGRPIKITVGGNPWLG